MERLTTALIDQWLFDISVLSSPWMLLIVPLMFYLPFMLLKWLALTIPVWVPVAMLVGRVWPNPEGKSVEGIPAEAPRSDPPKDSQPA